ncbi:phosphoenolpyruvate synthase [Litorilinea aerophila]|nr:phosphoenolpyruvate synthase [Litorilinea aerophila]MCC9078936.1 phosphoenolpyruvate synthase [Litorilinea aerophila]
MAMTSHVPYILNFFEIHAADLPVVGGKGANLGEMTAAGFPVPEGFCLTTAAFRRFIEASGQGEDIYALLERVDSGDMEGVRRIGEQIRTTLVAVPIPEEIVQAVQNAWQRIGSKHAYAVRSSATAEDLPDASFAGQQDTYLNVRGLDALLDAIRRCWVSLFNDRAILYRSRNRFSHRDVALSVVVQRMVLSELAGTLFTADPVTGHRHTLVIDASFGLGEALVSGLVSPDSYRVDKRTRAILEREIAEKTVAIWPDPGGGTRQEVLPPEMRTRAALNDAQILALADLGCRVESHYGQPQDLEWAIAEDRIYLLQTRPITSLYPIDGLASPDGTLHIYFSMGHQQNMTRAMAPLSLSTFPLLIPFGHEPGQFDNPYLRTSGGRLFADITQPLRHPILRRGVFILTSQFDALAPQALRLVMQRPEFRGPHRMHFSYRFLRGVLRILGRVFLGLWWRDLSDFVAQTNELMDTFIAKIRRRFRAQPPGKAQIQEMLAAMGELFPFFLNWVPEAAAGIAATRLLPRLARHWLPPEKVESLTLGIPGNVVNEMNLSLSDLAALARRSPVLVERFKHLENDAHAWLDKTAQTEDGRLFLKAWQEFLTRYGARGPAEIDIMMPRWYEDPLPLLRVIAGHIEKETNSRIHFTAQAQAREEAFIELLSLAQRGLMGPLRVRLLKRLYHVLTTVGGMREHHKFLAVRFLWEVKQVLKENAACLVAEGKLATPDDIWFLTWRELLAIWDEDATDWGTVISRRRADLERYQKLIPPLIITSDGETPVVRYQVAGAPPNALQGNPVSPGVVEGVAHVIHDPTNESLKPGEILVAPFTDPGWTPLFINAAGLVMEIGGVLAHGSVVAREYGIPAVVGVREATKKIRNGHHIRVDGNRGLVEILDGVDAAVEENTSARQGQGESDAIDNILNG